MLSVFNRRHSGVTVFVSFPWYLDIIEKGKRGIVNGEVDGEEWIMGRMVFSLSAGITHAAVDDGEGSVQSERRDNAHQLCI